MTDIEAPHRLAYEQGSDPIDYAVALIALDLEVRDQVAAGQVSHGVPITLLDQDDQAYARRIIAKLLDAGWLPPADTPAHRVILAKPAGCHPDRPLAARGLCRSCYEMAWRNNRLNAHPAKRTQRRRHEFVPDYELLRSEGYTRNQIAERLGMTRNALDQAYYRAVRAGDLEPDRRRAA